MDSARSQKPNAKDTDFADFDEVDEGIRPKDQVALTLARGQSPNHSELASKILST